MSLLFLLILLALVFVSCGGREKNKPKQKDNNHKISDTKETNIDDEDGKNALIWGVMEPFNDDEDKNIKVIRKKWEPELNRLLKKKGLSYKIKFKSIEFDEDKINKYKEGKDKFDIITVSNVAFSLKSPYKVFVENGIFEELDRFLENEEGKKIKDNIHERDLEISKVNGHVYGLSTSISSLSSMAYDLNALKSIGVDIKKIDSNLFNNIDVLNKLKNKYKKPPIVIRSAGEIFDLGGFVPQPCDFLFYDKKGEFVSGYTSKEYRDRLFRLRKLKDEGLLRVGELDKDTLVRIFQDETFRRDRFIAYSMPIDYKNTKKDCLVVPDENKPIVQLLRGDYKTGIYSKSENKKIARDFLTRLFTDSEIANTIQFGKENKDYKIDTGGNLKDISNYENEFYFSSQVTNQLITHSTLTEEKDKKSYQDWFYKKYGVGFPFGFRFDGSEVQEYIDACNFVISGKPYASAPSKTTYQKLLALEYSNIDEGLEELDKELKDAGIDKVIKEINRQLEEWRKGE